MSCLLAIAAIGLVLAAGLRTLRRANATIDAILHRNLAGRNAGDHRFEAMHGPVNTPAKSRRRSPNVQDDRLVWRPPTQPAPRVLDHYR